MDVRIGGLEDIWVNAKQIPGARQSGGRLFTADIEAAPLLASLGDETGEITSGLKSHLFFC